VETGDPRARRVVGFVFLTVFLDLVGFGIIIPLLPFYVKSMSGSAETVGFILASFSFTQLVATPFLGRLSDRLGRRPVILISLAGNAASMVLFALATKTSLLWLLFVSRIMAGATAGNLAACQAAIADVTQGEARAAGMGRLGAGIGLGMVLGPVLGSSVSHFGAWAPPLAAAGMALADLVAAFFFMPETHPASSSRPGAAATTARTRSDARSPGTPSLWHVLTQRRLLIVLVLYFLTFLYMTNMQVALALLTNARLGWTAKEIGNVFGLFGLIMLVVQGLLIGRMTRAWGSIPLVVAGSVLSMLGLATIAFGYHAVPVIAGLLLLGAGLGIVNPCLSSIAADYAGRERAGTVLGFAQSCGGLARTVGPVLGGLLYARVATGAPFLAGALAALLAGILSVALLADTRRAPPDAAVPSAR
jgi:DHA1 family tetracycline resistance protein-like MFS transporter